MMILKGLIIALIVIMGCATVACGGAYDDMNRAIDKSGYDTALHVAVGGLGSLALDSWLPEDMKEPYRTIAVVGIPFVLAVTDECFNKNFRLGDPLEVLGASIGTVTILSIDF
jgi:hypothetical protein